MKTQHLRYWTYGKIEARVSIPSFQGSWPAFWMLGESISSVGWPSCGEIDVMEHVNTSNEIHGTIHWQDHHDQYANYGAGTPYLGAGYHVYEVQWDAQYIKWFLDGNQFHTVNIENGINGTTEFHHDFFILLNMAVGGNWPGFNVDDAAFPAKMYVDYIRVYQDQITHTGDQNQPVMGSIKLFPNPTSNLLVIKAMGERYAIRDIMGLELSRGDFHNKSAFVVTSNYPSGMYYISVYDENAIIGTKIFVVKK